MTVADIDVDTSYCTIDSKERFSLTNMPFSTWMILQLATSFLYPRNCQLRQIEDKGSISESLYAAKIDIFNLIESKPSFFMKAMRYVALFAIGFFTILPAAVLGVCYHGCDTIKHLFLVLTDKQESGLHWEKVHMHKNRMICDLLCLALSTCGGMTFVLCSGHLFVPFIAASLCWGLFALDPYTYFFPGDKTFLPSYEEKYAWHKSLILHQQFGLASAPEGGLLAWDEWKDADICVPDYRACLIGYFGDLYSKSADEYANAILELGQLLSEEQKNQLLDCSIYEKIKLLNKNLSKIGLSKKEIKEWEGKLYLLNDRLQKVQGVVLEGYKRAYMTKVGFINFPDPLIERLGNYRWSAPKSRNSGLSGPSSSDGPVSKSALRKNLLPSEGSSSNISND